MARTLLSLAVLSLLASCNCELVQCIRHSDCPQDLVCGAGVCGVPLSADTDTDAFGTSDTDLGESEESGSSEGTSTSGGDSSSSGDASSTGDPSGTSTGPDPGTTTGTTGPIDTDTDTDTDGTSALPLARTPEWP